MSTGDDDEDEPTKAPTAPARPRAFLIVLQGLTAGKVVELEKPTCIIGRDDEADFTLPDRGISGIHAVITLDSNGVVSVEDLRSTNGTRVNEQLIGDIRTLQDGDTISIGATTILKFTCDGALEEALEKRLAGVGRFDPLTGAYRERYFNEFLQEEFAYSRRHKLPLSLVVISVDHFQGLLTVHGSEIADQMLAEFARRARAILQDQHLFARLGHRTFALLCRALPGQEAGALADDIRLAVSRTPINVGNHAFDVTISAGISWLPFPGIRSEKELLRMADVAVHDAKVTHDSVVPTKKK